MSIPNFVFTLPHQVLFGAGKLAETGPAVAALGRKALLVCDPVSVQTGVADRLTESLERAGVAVHRYSGVIPNPPVASIDAGAQIAREQACDVIVGLGGGSAMDTAKAIAVAASHEGSIWPYAMGEKPITDKTLPIVAVTTTSGTGSQCTCFSVISNPQTHQKPGMGSPYILPRVAVVDPELMLTAPPALTFSTGFDVFCHAVEAYTSTASNPMSDLLAEKAIALTVQFLLRAYTNGQDLEARAGMALADTYSGIAINHGAVSLGHVLAHVLGGHFDDIPHGDALRAIYREVLRVNAPGVPEKHRAIANLLDPGSADLPTAFEKFFAQFPFDNKLKAKAPSPAKLRALAEDTFTYMKAIVDLNPVAVNVEDAYRVLSASVC